MADRVAQAVVKMVLEPFVEPAFHQDSYNYRPGKSALDAVGVARTRCWEADSRIHPTTHGPRGGCEAGTLVLGATNTCNQRGACAADR